MTTPYTFAGAVSLAADPTTSLGPATKQYVDQRGGTAGSGTGGRPSSPAAGQHYWRTDKNFMEVWDGALWRVPSGAACAPADVSNPYDGQLILNTADAYRTYRYSTADAVWYQVLGRLGSNASGTSSFSLTTTEQVVSSLTLTLAAGVLVRTGVTFVANANTAGDNGFFKIRQKKTSTVDTSGTLVPKAQAAPNVSRGGAGDNNSIALTGEFTPATSGTYVIAWTGKMGTGTGNVAADAANHGWLFWADAVGS